MIRTKLAFGSAVCALLALAAVTSTRARASGLSCEELYRQNYVDWKNSGGATAIASWEATVQSRLPGYELIATALNTKYLDNFTSYDRRRLQSWLDGEYKDAEAVMKAYADSPRTNGLNAFNDVTCEDPYKRTENAGYHDGMMPGRYAMKDQSTKIYCLTINGAVGDPKTRSSFTLYKDDAYQDLESIGKPNFMTHRQFHAGADKKPPSEAEKRRRLLDDLGFTFSVALPTAPGSTGDGTVISTTSLSLLDFLKMEPGHRVTARELAEHELPKPKTPSFADKWLKNKPQRCPKEMPIDLSDKVSDAGPPKAVAPAAEVHEERGKPPTHLDGGVDGEAEIR